MTSVLKITDTKLGELYSVYSIPNMVLPLFAGSLIDYYGSRAMLTVTFFTTLVGNLIFAIGGRYDNFNVILVGYCIFGIGN